MANETHSLKIGSTTYPIYSTGGFIKSTSTDKFYPLVFSNDLGSESGTYRKLNTAQFVAGCKLGNITAPDAGYIKSSSSAASILPPNKVTASQNCAMLTKGYTNADGNLSAVLLSSVTLSPGKGFFLDSTKFNFYFSYQYDSASGPMEYKIGNSTYANCYAGIYIVDNSNNTLARSYVNLAKTYKHPNINASTTDTSKTKVYTIFENSFTIQPLSYANTSTSTQYINIYVVPFTTNLNWKNREALIPIHSSTIYPRNYVINDLQIPTPLPGGQLPGGGIVIPGEGGDIINPVSGDTENTPATVASGTPISGIITNEVSAYQNLVVNWSLSKVNTNNDSSVLLNNNTIIKNSYGSGLGTSTLINSTNMCFAKNGLWLGVNNEVNHNITNITNKDITLYGQYANLRLTSSTDYPGLEVLPNYNILYEKPNIYISTDTLESTSTGEDPDFIFLNKSSTVNSRTLEVRPFSSMQYNLGTSTYRWKEINGYNIYKNGSAVSTSDERYKDFIDDINIDFDDIKRIPKKLFTWKDGKFYDGKKIHIGTSAQKVKEIYPELVYIYNTSNCTDINDEKAILGVDYEKMSIIALAAIDKLNENINSIESLLNTIEADIDYNNNKLKSIKKSLSIYG